MRIKKRLLAVFLAVAMLLTQMQVTFAADSEPVAINLSTVTGDGTGYTYASNVVTITQNGDYLLTQDTESTMTRVVVTAVSVNITLKDVYILVSSGNSPFSVSEGSTVHLTLSGNNTLIAGYGSAGLHVPSSASIIISGDGTLTAKGGDYNNGASNGAGIGGMGAYGDAGSITILGGTVNAFGGPYAAGIGGGNNTNGTGAGSGGNITIAGGTVTATGNNHSAAIGGGCRGNGGNITISGGTVTATAGSYSAAIGGGFTGGAGNIYISGGMVTATGKNSAPGIGRDSSSPIDDSMLSGGTDSAIVISGGTVIATGASELPGIGSDGTANDPTTLVISGGSVQSTSLPIAPVNASSEPIYLTCVSIKGANKGRVLDKELTYTMDEGSSVSVWTDELGTLYLWLTEGSHMLDVTINGVSYQAALNVSNQNGNPHTVNINADGVLVPVTNVLWKDYQEPVLTTGVPYDFSGQFSVLPVNATYKDLTVSIEDEGGTGAVMSDTAEVTATSPGTFRLSVTVNYADGSSMSMPFDITVRVVNITTEALPDGTVGEEYSYMLTADGDEPVTWSIDGVSSSPFQQTNLNLETTGLIHGTPMQSGLYTFTVKAENDEGSVTKELSLNILPGPDYYTVEAACEKAQNAVYQNMTQADVASKQDIVNALKATALAAVNDNTVTVSIIERSYTAPTAGTADNPGGTDGSYSFSVHITKGVWNQDTYPDKTITITATPYIPSDTEVLQYLALGDSIATGYGLEGYGSDTTPEAAYVSIVMNELGLSGENAAIDGMNSTQLLALLNSLPEEAGTAFSGIKVITLSIGSNDLLAPFTLLVAQTFGISITGKSGSEILEEIQSSMAAAASNEAQWAGICGGLTSAVGYSAPSFTAAADYCTANISSILGKLNTLVPDAQIYITNVYNPYEGVKVGPENALLDLGALTAPYIAYLNGQLAEAVAGAGRTHLVDISSAFSNSDVKVVNADGLTGLDPHPNAAGHALIAQLVMQSIDESNAVASVGGVFYTTWAQAAAAVPEGGTIILKKDVALAAGDSFPAVSCTLDGESHTVTPASGMSLNADITLKDISFDFGSGAEIDCGGYNITIEGEVDISAVQDAFQEGGSLTVNGLLNDETSRGACRDFLNLTLSAGGTLRMTYCIFKEAIINGTLECKALGIRRGTLSGDGTIITLGLPSSDGANLMFMGASVADDAAITLEAGAYTPSPGQVVAINAGEGIVEEPIENMDRLMLGSGFEDFELSYSAGRYLLAEAATHTVAVQNNGNGTASGGGTYSHGQRVTLGAVPAAGYNFDGWYVGVVKISALPNYTFTVTKSIILTAHFTAMPQSNLEVTVTGGGSVRLNNETAALDSSYTAQYSRGTGIRLTAAPDSGYQFSYWQDIRSGSILSTAPVYEFIMGAGAALKAVFTRVPDTATTEFTVIFKDKSGRILQSVSVEKNQPVTPPASPTLVGYTFIGWDKELDSITSDLTVNAVYERLPATYTVTVVNGTLSDGTSSGAFQYDRPVTVVAGTAPAGQKFSHWEQDGVRISVSSTYSFYAPMRATTLTAIYVTEETAIVATPFITLSSVVEMDTSAKNILFTANRTLPAGYTLIESGVLLLNSNTALTDELTVDTPGVIRGKIKNDSTEQFHIRKNSISAGDTWYGRAYLIYQDAAGNIVTVYSENTENRTMD